jgi:sodium/hydrogen antiporter
VTCTDPILSQAIAKGPFADKFVARELREIISSEAGANDGFGFPFLMLATFLLRYATVPTRFLEHGEPQEGLVIHATEHADVGRLGGGAGIALLTWVIDTWLYTVLMSVFYGIVVGYGSCLLVRFVLRKKWIDDESYLLFPAGLGVSGFPWIERC